MKRNNSHFREASGAVFAALVAALLVSAAPVGAKTTDTVDKYSLMPLNVIRGIGVTPMVMLNASNDHQLFFKVYDDYSDMDGDGVPDTTYKHSINYYGYFDSFKCYAYDPTYVAPDGYAGRFVPVGFSPNKYCNLDAKAKAVNTATKVNQCRNELASNRVDGMGANEREAAYRTCLAPSGETSVKGSRHPATNWKQAEFSGNFLNWVTMSRIDAVRKILFGGHRRVDSSTDTVLERAFLPPDAHSWAKHYDGPDLPNLTPFYPGFGSGGIFGYPQYYCDRGDASKCGSDKTKIGVTFGNTTDVYIDNYPSTNRTGTSTDRTGWVDRPNYPNYYKVSQFMQEPPVMKAAAGNYLLWGATAGQQLGWRHGAGNLEQLYDKHPGDYGDDPPPASRAGASIPR